MMNCREFSRFFLSIWPDLANARIKNPRLARVANTGDVKSAEHTWPLASDGALSKCEKAFVRRVRPLRRGRLARKDESAT